MSGTVSEGKGEEELKKHTACSFRSEMTVSTLFVSHMHTRSVRGACQSGSTPLLAREVLHRPMKHFSLWSLAVSAIWCILLPSTCSFRLILVMEVVLFKVHCFLGNVGCQTKHACYPVLIDLFVRVDWDETLLQSVNVQIMKSGLHNYISDYFPMGGSQRSRSKERWKSRKREEAGAGAGKCIQTNWRVNGE